MILQKNLFKAALVEGRQQLGLWNSLPGPVVAEALAGTGYDWILVDCEHALTDVPDVLSNLQAMAPYPVSAVVRPADNDPVLIKRILDFGAQSLLIPYVQTPAEAERAVAAMRYAPRGMRGMGLMTRATRYGTVEDYALQADAEMCLLVQVETAATLPLIEEIAAVDGVDGMFIGPADLSATMGYPGQLYHPEVVAAIEDAVRRIKATGKAAGILTPDLPFARSCIEWGTTFTAIGADLSLLVSAARGLVTGFRQG